jgi:hypothetical protein
LSIWGDISILLLIDLSSNESTLILRSVILLVVSKAGHVSVEATWGNAVSPSLRD